MSTRRPGPPDVPSKLRRALGIGGVTLCVLIALGVAALFLALMGPGQAGGSEAPESYSARTRDRDRVGSSGSAVGEAVVADAGHQLRDGFSCPPLGALQGRLRRPGRCSSQGWPIRSRRGEAELSDRDEGHGADAHVVSLMWMRERAPSP